MARPEFFNFKIEFEDNTALTFEPEYISKVEIDRVVSDAANKFTISLLDDAAYTVEKKLIQGKNNLTITYFNLSGSVKETFNGHITKMNSSFINNRNMLTLEGYVGITVFDKYQLKSRNWNVIPLPNWCSLLGFEKMPEVTRQKADLAGFLDYFFEVLFSHPFDVSAADDPDYGKNNQIVKYIDEIFEDNLLLQTDDGSVYLEAKYDNEKLKIKKGDLIQCDMINLPVRPHKILKLIAEGGYMTELFEASTSISKVDDTGKVDVSAYKYCAAFYNAEKRRGETAAYYDAIYIKKYLAKFPKIEGNGWSYEEPDVYKTRMTDADFTQSNMSDIRYIQEVLSQYAILDDGNYDQDSYNFKFSIDSKKHINFKPIAIEPNATPKAVYEYYGEMASISNSDGNSALISFSADTNFLTAFLTGNTKDINKLSTMNLITGNEMDISTTYYQDSEITQKIIKESAYKYTFDTKVFAPLKLSGSSISSVNAWKEYWFQAMCQTYKANANIIGYSGLKPGDYVEFIVIPKPGLYHHTSGLYFILKQKDVFENGKLTTNLELIKNIATMGNSSLNTYK